MAYSLDEKIIRYLEERGAVGASIRETLIVIPTPTGELHRRILGVINSDKLDAIIDEYKKQVENGTA